MAGSGGISTNDPLTILPSAGLGGINCDFGGLGSHRCPTSASWKDAVQYTTFRDLLPFLYTNSYQSSKRKREGCGSWSHGMPQVPEPFVSLGSYPTHRRGWCQLEVPWCSVFFHDGMWSGHAHIICRLLSGQLNMQAVRDWAQENISMGHLPASSSTGSWWLQWSQ